MLPEAELPLRLVDDAAYPDFLGPQDEPWLRVLMDEIARFEGRRRRELVERLGEPLPCESPVWKRKCATRVLLGLWKGERRAAASPAVVRAVVFGAAGLTGADRDRVWTEAAVAFRVPRAALEESLFADLPGERIVTAPAERPGAAEVALRTNLAIAQTLLMRAAVVDLSLFGAVRPIVRLAKLRGLICVAKGMGLEPEAGGPDAGLALEVSGPFSLFRHTLLYGRALAELLPHLAFCARFSLRARSALRGRVVDVRLDRSAPIFAPVTKGPPATFDSALEARFADDFARLAPDWDVVREPRPVPAGGSLIFPDFLLRHRLLPDRQALLEIVGFWTPAYLEDKLAKLRAAGIANLILCVDEERGCANADLPEGAEIVKFRRRVDAAAVLEVLSRRGWTA